MKYILFFSLLFIPLVSFAQTSGERIERLIDGGEGVDTIDYAGVLYRDATVLKRGALREVQTPSSVDSLANMEFIKFADVIIDAQTLQPVSLEEYQAVVQKSADRQQQKLPAENIARLIEDLPRSVGSGVTIVPNQDLIRKIVAATDVPAFLQTVGRQGIANLSNEQRYLLAVILIDEMLKRRY